MQRRQVIETVGLAIAGLSTGCTESEPHLAESPTPTASPSPSEMGTPTPGETATETPTPDDRQQQGSIPALRMPRFALRVENRGEDDERVWVEGYLRNDTSETTEETEVVVVIYGRDDEELERVVEGPPDGTLEPGEVWGYEFSVGARRSDIGGWTANPNHAGSDDQPPGKTSD